jgi:DNA-binding transcriptional regulator GbsR (MarR family)
MKTVELDAATVARERLVELGGRTAQDLGLGRIAGQLLAYLYLQPAECSLDQIEHDLGLSKAAVSTAARRLEAFGLIRQVWKRGDRRNYYRTADNLGVALQQGLMALLRSKLEAAGAEMDEIRALLEDARRADRNAADIVFLHERLKRANTLRERVASILDNRLVKHFFR